MTGARPSVCLVGGPDVDARLDFMNLLSREFDVSAAGTDPLLGPRFAAAGFEYRYYRMSRRLNPLLDMYSLWRLVRLFHREQPTIVHTFDTKPAVWGRLAARLAGVPIVVGTLPGLGSLYTDPDWTGRLTRAIYQRLQTFVSRHTDLTLFQNADDAREFERRGVVPRHSVAIVHGSGIRTDLFAPPKSRDNVGAGRAELGLPATGVVVVMVSRILRSKGVLEFAAAARQVRQAAPEVTFLLVGPTDLDSRDTLTAGELAEVRRSVLWVGLRNDVKDILALSDVFVFPSFYREGIPRALLEAASMALPLVAVDGPGSRDVVVDGVNGFLVPPRNAEAIRDAVLRLARDPALRSRFGERARQRAIAEFDVARVAERTCSLYRALLAGRHGAR